MDEEKELRDFLNSRGINLESFLEEPLDADEFLKENAKMMKRIDPKRMKKSGDRDIIEILSEEEAYHFLRERGFEDESITTSSMEGANFDAVEISDRASAKHPCYQTKYESDNGEFWIISLIGKDITAYPLFFNQASSLGAELIVAESEMVTSYDSTNNMFYQSIPKESTLIVKRVNRIDKETLDGLTAEVMGQ